MPSPFGGLVVGTVVTLYPAEVSVCVETHIRHIIYPCEKTAFWKTAVDWMKRRVAFLTGFGFVCWRTDEQSFIYYPIRSRF
jgi:hypothetical protein